MNNDPVEETAPQPDVDMAPKEPEPFEFSATMPAMSAQDL
jgi:splicing factor 3A subunit 1